MKDSIAVASGVKHELGNGWALEDHLQRDASDCCIHCCSPQQNKVYNKGVACGSKLTNAQFPCTTYAKPFKVTSQERSHSGKGFKPKGVAKPTSSTTPRSLQRVCKQYLSWSSVSMSMKEGEERSVSFGFHWNTRNPELIHSVGYSKSSSRSCSKEGSGSWSCVS